MSLARSRPRLLAAPALTLFTLLGLALALAALAPAEAEADLRRGSHHELFRDGGLAMPVPQMSGKPRLSAGPGGRLRLTAAVRYRAANWSGRPEVARDRAMITVKVAKRRFVSGGVRELAFRHAIVHRLGKKRVHRRYRLSLPRAVSRLLIRRGALAPQPRRRLRALKLVSVDVQLDRDFRAVDGRYDWREGTAWSAADPLRKALRERAGRGKASASSSYRSPSGTLTLINNTAAGVYCERGCPLVEQDTGLPGTIEGTINQPAYRVPIAVAGAAVQCFDQEAGGSNPEGFANFNSQGEPQPYLPGEAVAGGGELPATTGTAVTQELAADYTLAWASQEEVKDVTGLVSGGVKLGLQTVKLAGTGFVSPGAVITGILGIFEYFLENSCKEAGNYFNLTASEPSGGTASETIDADDENWGTYPGTGSTPYGLQMNPSLISREGTKLHLFPDAVRTPGLADNACLGCSSDNVIELNWTDYDPCSANTNCRGKPPTSPTVENARADLNCGKNNLKCPFPAAGWPVGRTGPPIYAGLSNGMIWRCSSTISNNCQVLDEAGPNGGVNALALGEKSLYAGLANGIVWKCPAGAANGCKKIDITGEAEVLDLVVAEGAVYAGLSNGVLWKCPTSPGTACQVLDNTQGPEITSLAAGFGWIYAGRSDGILWACSPTAADNCLTLDNAGKNTIESLSIGGGLLYAGIGNGVIWECLPDVGNYCQDIGLAGGSVTTVAAAAGKVFAGFEQESDETLVFWRCSPIGVLGSCENWGGGSASVLTAAGSSVYYASSGQTLGRCSTTTAFSCTGLDQTNSSKTRILSLAVPTKP